MNIKTIIGLNSIVGIEVNFISETVVHYYAVLVSISKGKLKMESIETESHSFEQLQDKIPQKTPVCLALTGKGVLVKQYEQNDNANEVSILNSVFPFAKPNEFTFNNYNNENSFSWAAVVRNEQITNISDLFVKAGINILDIFIGPMILNHILSFVDNSESNITTSAYKIEISENNIISINKRLGEDHVYKVSEKEIHGRELLPFAAAFTFLVINNKKCLSKLISIKTQSTEYLLDKVVSLFTKVSIGLLFVLLLSSFFIYSHYDNKINSVNQDVFKNRSLLNKKKKLSIELKEKQILLARTGLDTESHLSNYADIIASIRPKNMTFLEMTINPVEINQYKKNLIIKKNTIRILGSSNSSLQINNWIIKLSKLKFIKTAELIDLKYSADKKATVFELEIIIIS
ncbi:MAG: hypothetical protein QM503_03135 [Bacteroidota bacterium]